MLAGLWNLDLSMKFMTSSFQLQPGMFPKSLRGYVERALARCKDDGQMAACQAVMKEVSISCYNLSCS